MKKTLITIVGPTAIGKTAVAINVALHFKTEIISADSRQFYRELNAGTAKPSAEELKQIKHHFINSLSIHDSYSVGQFEIDSLACLDELFQHHDVVVAVGGSGLFIDVLCHGMDQLPESDPGLRTELKNLFKEKGLEALQQKLSQIDPEYFQTIDRANPHRLIRAIEVCQLTGIKYSEIRKNKKKKRPFEIIKIGLDEDRSIVYQRINERVDAMLNSGLLEEAKAHHPFGHLNALKTVGYQELFDFFENKATLEEAIERIKQNTRRFAKRQLTWFRRDNEMIWVQANDKSGIIQLINEKLNDANHLHQSAG